MTSTSSAFGQRLRAGQRNLLAQQLIGEQARAPRPQRCRASTMGAVEAAAYGPLTTSPTLICGAHMPKKLVTNTVGRRLTHSKPESTAYCSTSLLRSPRKRDG